MQPLLRSSIGLWALVAVLVLGVACDSNEPAQGPTCGGPMPAFAFTVRTASGAPLPHDLRIDVTYGGTGTESFVLSAPPASPSVVFCGYVLQGDGDATPKTDAPADADVIAAIQCQLWTDGAAEVVVTSTGLATYDETLEATSSDCGLTTTAEVAELTLPTTPPTNLEPNSAVKWDGS